MDALGMLIPLLAFPRQLPTHLHTSFGDGDSEVGYPIEPQVDDLAIFWHILVLVVEKFLDIRPF